MYTLYIFECIKEETVQEDDSVKKAGDSVKKAGDRVKDVCNVKGGCNA